LFNPDGTVKTDENGEPLTVPIDNADSGILPRYGVGKAQVNLFCWPCGSGHLWGQHTSDDPEIRKGALPRVKADKPVGEWNQMEITMIGDKIKVILNGIEIIDSRILNADVKAPIGLQSHGGKRGNEWSSASSLVQFRNIWIKELSE
jgi:hypothetical protein